MSENAQADITTLTVQLLSAFVSNNSVPSENLAELIKTTRTALTEDLAAKPADAETPTYTPAVSVRKSIASPEHILSLIDGRPYKTLKRHLATHGLSPDEYRARYNLPKSYPLVAPNYSEARRAVANKLGLGRKPVSGKAAPADAAPAKTPKPAAPKPAKTAAAAKAAAPKPAPAKAAPAKTAAGKPAAAKPAAERTKLSIAAPANGGKDAAAAPAAKTSASKPAKKKAPAKAAAPKATEPNAAKSKSA